METNSTRMSIKHVTCKNCERTFKDDYNFCPYCGQNDKEELTLGVLFSNTISNYFSVDARFFKSFIPLMIKPGYLAKRFIEGKRLMYLHPAQIYLFVSIVFFFLFSFISRNQVETMDKVFKEDLKNIKTLDTSKLKEINDELSKNEDLQNIRFGAGKNLESYIKPSDKNNEKEILSFDFGQKNIDSLIEINAPDPVILKEMGMPDDAGYLKRKFYSRVLKFYKQRSGSSFLQGFYDSIPIAMFFLLPIFALLLKLMYYKKGRFSHHLVFSFYFFAFLFTVFSILVFLDLVLGIPLWLEILVMLSTFFYLVLAVKRFYNQSFFLSFIKSNVAAISFLLFVVPFAMIIMVIVAFMFY